ncbi:MAG: DNA-protecting protein DprA [Waddliaceae bacterium]|nr:DNA-protecting protein DprA [Waddliaceae bacterium]MBT6928125.1 DNA-protecting protein DprA [Waddliaceae bacterium]
MRTLIKALGSARAVVDADTAEIANVKGINSTLAEKITATKGEDRWKCDLSLVDKHGIHLISYLDSCYPRRLREISNFPLLLYIRGSVDVIGKQGIALVGTRNPSSYGYREALRFSRELSSLSFSIISGLALGIDTAAHQGALDKGSTCAVIGSGISSLYPRENEGLADMIVDCGGAIISEFPMMATPERHHFPLRNRIVSGLSSAVLLIEAPCKSGAMLTSEAACSQGRPLFTIPGRLDDESFRGNHRLIKSGRALLAEGGADIAEYFSDLFRASAITV